MGRPAHSRLRGTYPGPTRDLVGLGVAHLLDRGVSAFVRLAATFIDPRLCLVDRDLGRLELVTFLHDGARFVQFSAQLQCRIGFLLAVPAA